MNKKIMLMFLALAGLLLGGRPSLASAAYLSGSPDHPGATVDTFSAATATVGAATGTVGAATGTVGAATGRVGAATGTVGAATDRVGAFPGTVHEAAFVVDAGGTVHVVWSGTLNPHFPRYVFYSSSADGVTWTPYQFLNAGTLYDLKMAVDNTHGRAHVVYRINEQGFLHHTIANGVVSAATRVDRYCSVGLEIGVDETTGYLHAVCRQGHYVPLGDALSFRYYTYYNYWDGSDWRTRLRVINDDDTFYSAVAVASGQGVMLAWFQRWAQSLGGSIDPGEPTVPRTAYGTAPGKFSLRQAVSAEYPVPEKDNSILLAYASGDQVFVLATYHLMWPGHSRFYRYLWQNGTWSAALDVAGNTTGWAAPRFVGGSTNPARTYYVYTDNDQLKMRTESAGVLSTPLVLADYLAARGYIGYPMAYFVTPQGELHMLVSADKDGVHGLYYLAP